MLWEVGEYWGTEVLSNRRQALEIAQKLDGNQILVTQAVCEDFKLWLCLLLKQNAAIVQKTPGIFLRGNTHVAHSVLVSRGVLVHLERGEALWVNLCIVGRGVAPENALQGGLAVLFSEKSSAVLGKSHCCGGWRENYGAILDGFL